MGRGALDRSRSFSDSVYRASPLPTPSSRGEGEDTSQKPLLSFCRLSYGGKPCPASGSGDPACQALPRGAGITVSLEQFLDLLLNRPARGHEYVLLPTHWVSAQSVLPPKYLWRGRCPPLF